MGPGRRGTADPASNEPRFAPLELRVGLALAGSTILAIDLQLPLGLATGVLYAAVVLLSGAARDWRTTAVTAVAGTVFTGVGMLASSSIAPTMQVLFNRGLSVLSIWGAAGWVFHRLHTERLAIAIEAHLRAEMAETTNLLDQFFRLSADILCITNAEGFMTRVNAACERALGYPADALVGNTLTSFVLPNDAHLTQASLDRLGAEPSVAFENRALAGDGSVRWLAWRVSRSGNGAVFAVARDVTEQREMIDALRAAEARLRAAAKGSSDGLWDWVDTSRDEQWWSARLYEQLGYEDGAFPAGFGEWSDRIHPEDVDQALRTVRTHLDDTNFPCMVECRWRTRSGEYRWFQIRGRASREGPGLPIRMAGTLTDIDERKRAELRLEQTAQNLAESRTALQQFAEVASHDLHAPLQGIQAVGHRLVDETPGDLDAPTRREVSAMVHATERVGQLVADLVDYSHAATQHDPHEPVDLETIVRDVVDESAARSESGATVTVDPLPTVLGNAAQLSRLFAHLLDNAVKYRHPDRTPAITVSATPPAPGESHVHVSVEDNGIGFEPEESGRIFEIFGRLHPPDAIPGTGLGLAICRTIAERHGGSVTARTRPGEGSTFTVVLPVPALDGGRSGVAARDHRDTDA